MDRTCRKYATGAGPFEVYPRHCSAAVEIRATPSEVFAFADDHDRLSSHMSRSSWAMGGGSMTIEVDDRKGRSVGSKLRLRGTVFGFRLEVEEVVTERTPPWLKTWETIGEPRLIVIGAYRMGFAIKDLGDASRLTVSIGYALPRRAAWRWFGLLFGRAYARWCTGRMARDTAGHFRAAHAAAGPGP